MLRGGCKRDENKAEAYRYESREEEGERHGQRDYAEVQDPTHPYRSLRNTLSLTYFAITCNKNRKK